ncbi:MAG: tyrosine-protein phosphatase, partial [Treponema sp.]|nr:tyrosine-protein phosphatase [Treponema sp.]
FANFRAVKAGKIAENRLYRSCNPLAGDERAPYAEKLIAKANIQTVINLADTPEYAVSHYKSSPYYESLTKNGNVIFLNMGIAFTDEEFTKKLHDGLVFMSEHKVGPYLIHCNEGKDRAGFVNAILAAINEATMKEMVEDYMLSFENYFGVKKDSEQYKLIAQTVPDMFKAINGGRKVDNQTVQWVAERYLLKKVKLTRKQLKELKKVLQ